MKLCSNPYQEKNHIHIWYSFMASFSFSSHFSILLFICRWKHADRLLFLSLTHFSSVYMRILSPIEIKIREDVTVAFLFLLILFLHQTRSNMTWNEKMISIRHRFSYDNNRPEMNRERIYLTVVHLFFKQSVIIRSHHFINRLSILDVNHTCGF